VTDVVNAETTELASLSRFFVVDDSVVPTLRRIADIARARFPWAADAAVSLRPLVADSKGLSVPLGNGRMLNLSTRRPPTDEERADADTFASDAAELVDHALAYWAARRQAERLELATARCGADSPIERMLTGVRRRRA
jgi:hypothetical protein